MTDARLGEGLFAAVQKLPCGSGVIFRHYELPVAERARLFARIRRIAVRRGHVLLVAGDARHGAFQQSDGQHGAKSGRQRHPCKFLSMPVHNVVEIRNAHQQGADMMLLSPIYSTASHPGLRPLGPVRFRQLAALAYPAKLIALGGMNRAQAAKTSHRIAHGWAAIDAFAIRKAKPR